MSSIPWRGECACRLRLSRTAYSDPRLAPLPTASAGSAQRKRGSSGGPVVLLELVGPLDHLQHPRSRASAHTKRSPAHLIPKAEHDGKSTARL
eukprot:2200928-Rhodomonas_salina.2